MRILVTGGAGFIGSHIADLLIDKGYEVCIIDNLVNGKIQNINKKAKFYNIDIRDNKILDVFREEKPDVIVHHAAQIKVPISIENPIYDADINIMGSLNLLECARKTDVKMIVYAASAAIFGEPQYLPIDENHPLNMISGYGVTKHTVEHYLNVYKELYGINYVSLRYSNVYGPRQDSSGEGGVIAIFAEKFINNDRPVIFGDGKQIRDFVYVKDVAMANLMAIESKISGIYNVCTNTQISINDLVMIFNKILSKNVIPLYSKERVGDIRKSYMTYNKIFNKMGWKPKYNIEEGLKETLQYYKFQRL